MKEKTQFPLISVILPVYKVEKYLDSCVQSVVNQSYQNLEIILIDDGSPDNCPAMCDEWMKREPRIRVLHQKNAGVSAARNVGIKMAKGKLLVFVDSDDTMHPQMLERLFVAMQMTGAKIAECLFEAVNTQVVDCKRLSHSVETEILQATDIMGRLTIEVVPWGKIYDSSLFAQIEFPVDQRHEDEAIAHRLVWKAQTIARISETLYYYLQHRESFMANPSRSFDYDEVNALRNRMLFCREINLKAAMVGCANQYCKAIEQYLHYHLKSNDKKHYLEILKHCREDKKIVFSLLYRSNKIFMALYCFSPRLCKGLLSELNWLRKIFGKNSMSVNDE